MLRNFLTVLAFLAAIGVSAAATVEVVRQAVQGPVPVTVDGTVYARDAYPDGVLAMLLEYRFEPSGDRYQKRVVLDVLRGRLDRGGDLLAEWKSLSQTERQIVVRNVAALGPVWLEDRSDEYHRLPVQFRRRYLDQQLDEVLALASLYSALAFEDHRNLMRGLDLEQVRWELEEWLSRLPSDRQRQHLTFLRALQDRVGRQRGPLLPPFLRGQARGESR